ncbi:hypothetical protein Caci_2965 [Catenulispora acidiphila DSM 44928]|uniref:Uncharacterized protein n=1 Tax=Catenulispora acidiphila (strain DSM 44928 / JCM 14897 / NBRC 102108 / NRRL B-24433 / ID139908) TaxID=479433 RepID=C7Q2Y2_CATAD|nr:DUF6221 family protein [Catenulispora acidiphila]ACU71874.1 hypothetical protein Caci_2965 [Catenulispora acidiphila DSM 44928]
MIDIVAFSNARLDEREQLARGVVHAVGADYDALMVAAGKALELGMVSLYWRNHNPARVLREVAAQRQQLAEHEHVPAVRQSDNHLYDFGCRTCHNDPDCGETLGFGWCKTVRLMAEPFDEHPDYDRYDPAWRI